MKLKFWLAIVGLFYIAGLVYLVLPTPPVPDLPNSLISDEPGDTYQNPNTKAFYTNSNRQETLGYYETNYRVRLGSFAFPVLRLNYRPEDTATYVRKYVDSQFLEEIIHPLRESVFINGWNPKLIPENVNKLPAEMEKVVIINRGQKWEWKMTMRWYESNAITRILVWTLIFPLGYLLFRQLSLNLLALKAAFK